jgi:hypothetical protein
MTNETCQRGRSVSVVPIAIFLRVASPVSLCRIPMVTNFPTKFDSSGAASHGRRAEFSAEEDT